MSTTQDNLDNVLENVHELEDFLHALITGLDQPKLRHGDDVLRYAREMNLKVPHFLSGLDVTWESESSAAPQERYTSPIVLVRPGRPEAVGLTLGCVRIGRWKFCLECSWIFCRIVVTRRF